MTGQYKAAQPASPPAEAEARRPADRHKIKPTTVRLPPEISAWVERETERTGKPKRRVILDALREAKERSESG